MFICRIYTCGRKCQRQRSFKEATVVITAQIFRNLFAHQGILNRSYSLGIIAGPVFKQPFQYRVHRVKSLNAHGAELFNEALQSMVMPGGTMEGHHDGAFYPETG